MTQTCVCAHTVGFTLRIPGNRRGRVGYVVHLCVHVRYVYVLHLCVCLLHLCLFVCLPLCAECLPVPPTAGRTRQMNLRKVKGRNKILGAVFGIVADIFTVQ